MKYFRYFYYSKRCFKYTYIYIYSCSWVNRLLRPYRHTVMLPVSLSDIGILQSKLLLNASLSFFATSFHLKRGLPSGLFSIGFLSSTMRMNGFWLRQAYQAYCNLYFFIVSTIFDLYESVSNSSFFSYPPLAT